MKKSTVNLILIIFLSFSAFAKTNNALKKNKQISLNLVNIPLEQVLIKIEALTDYNFFYANNILDLNRLVTLKAKNNSITQILSKIFYTKELTFKIINKQIVINKKLPKKIIYGKVVNKITEEAIPNCSIVYGSGQQGTSTNSNGEFIIKIDSLPLKLTISHINFEKKTINVTNYSEENITLELLPLTNILDEVTINSKTKRDQYAIDLAKKAYEKSKTLTSKNKYGKAYYRQKSKNGDRYSELSEIIYDVRFNNNGIKNWEIIEGRYALKDRSINNKNYTYFSKIIKLLQPYTEDLIFPLNENLEILYNIKVIDAYKSKEGKIIVLYFKAKKDFKKLPIIDAEVYINEKTLEVLKISGDISKDNLNFVKITEKNAYKKKHSISYEMAYKKDETNGLVIDYIKINQEFDYYKDDKFKTHVSSNSNLTFFEYYNPVKRRKLGKNFRRRSSDWENIDKVGYNKAFWENNPIIKRTPIEKNVIEDFEKNNAFESIFINSRGQIDLIQSKISNSKYIEELDKKMLTNKNDNIIEKIYLHTNKDVVVSGKNLWFSIYNSISYNTINDIGSELVYVDLIDSNNKISASQTYQINKGSGSGSINIPENLQSGTYVLRAYTNWMRNFKSDYFFHKKIKILNPQKTTTNTIAKNDSIDLQFFPEGGHAIVNLPNKIAFKAIDSNGEGKDITGKIINNKGKHVTNFKSKENGGGSFFIIPKKGETYKAIINNGLEFLIPNIKEEGYALFVNNLNDNSINIKVRASKQLISKPFYVIGHMQNQKFFQGKFNFTTKTNLNIEIPKNKLPSGVFTITILGENKKAWAERVVFINNQNELIITTKLDKKVFKKKEKLTLNIHINDKEGKPVSTNFSVAINDANQLSKNINSKNILTHLLLESDVQGHIKTPYQYFKDNNRNTKSRLDLIMLTHGWRKIKWAKKNTDKKFTFSSGFTLSGYIKDKNGNLIKNDTFNIIAKSEELFNNYQLKTDGKGYFSIQNLKHKGHTELKLIPSKKNKNNTFNFVLDDRRAQSFLPKAGFKFKKKTLNTIAERKYLMNELNNNSIFSLDEKSISLDEVNIVGKSKKNKPKPTPSVYGIRPSHTVIPTDMHASSSVIDLLYGVAGVRVNKIGHEYLISIRNSPTPLFIIDGILLVNPPLNNSPAPGPITNKNLEGTPELIYALDANSIEKIEVLNVSRAAIFGNRGANGAILIYTKKGYAHLNNKKKTEPKYFTTGNSIEKEFYSPKYSIDPEKLKIPDYRTSLYWNPSVKTDKDGNAKVTFYNSDVTKNIQIVIEALSEFGNPGINITTLGK